MYLRISSLFTHGSRKTSLQVCFDRSPNSRRKILFFFWSKALTFFQTVFCLTTCHGPHLPLSLRHLPQENRFYFSKVITPTELGADGVGDTPCPFQPDRHVKPKVHGQVSKSGCPSDIQQRHSDFSRDDLRRHSCKILFDLSRSPEVFESSCDHHCPIFPWDGWKEKKKRLREFYFFQSFSKHLLSTCYVCHCAKCRAFLLILFLIGG